GGGRCAVVDRLRLCRRGGLSAGAASGVGRPGRALPPGGLPRRGERGHRRDAAVSRTRRRLTRPGLGAALRTAGAAAGQPAAEPARPAAVPAPGVPHGGRSGHALPLGHGVLDAPPAGAVRPRGAKPCCGGPGATRLWMALGFEAGPRGEVAGLLAGTIAAAGPRLALWRPSQATRLPGSVLGSPQT